MSEDRKEGRRANRRKFRPELEVQRLESRELLSSVPFSLNQYILTHPNSGVAKALGKPPQYQGKPAFKPVGQTVYDKGYAAVQTIRGGAGVQIGTPDGSHFRITLQLGDNQYDGGLTAQTGGSGTGVIPSTKVQAVGTIRAYATPGGSVGLIVDGTTSNMQVVIERLPFPTRKGYAHSFAYGQSGRGQVLNISSLNVTSGSISAILGYQTANLSGALTVGGGGTVDRIALNNLLPGASINVGGTLNTLDIYGSANLSSGPGINVKGDLNLLNVGQDFNISNGANFTVDRFVGLVPQPAKGTDTGSNIIALNQALIGSSTSTGLLVPGVSAYIRGNMNVGPGSVVTFVSGIANSSILGQAVSAPTVFLINGSLSVVNTNQLQIPDLLAGQGLIRVILPDGTVRYNNIVARNGIFVNGVPTPTIP
jgi:hypothetical protein